MLTGTWPNMIVWHSIHWWTRCEVLIMQWKAQAGYYWTLQRLYLSSLSRELLEHRKRRKRTVHQVYEYITCHVVQESSAHHTLTPCCFHPSVWTCWNSFSCPCCTEVQPEVNPKWEVLSEILNEIDGLSKQVAEKDPSYNNKVLVLVEDTRTCNQLKQVK